MKHLRNLSRNIQRLENLENYLSFPGYTFGNEENRFALFFIVNRTTTTIDRDGSFVLNLEYDGEPLFKDVTVDYEVSLVGCVKTKYCCSNSDKNY